MREESRCVHCHEEMGCIHEACPNFSVKCYYCDECKESAEFSLLGKDYCRDCAENQLDKMLSKNLTLESKVEILELDSTDFFKR